MFGFYDGPETGIAVTPDRAAVEERYVVVGDLWLRLRSKFVSAAD